MSQERGADMDKESFLPTQEAWGEGRGQRLNMCVLPEKPDKPQMLLSLSSGYPEHPQAPGPGNSEETHALSQGSPLFDGFQLCL